MCSAIHFKCKVSSSMKHCSGSEESNNSVLRLQERSTLVLFCAWTQHGLSPRKNVQNNLRRGPIQHWEDLRKSMSKDFVLIYIGVWQSVRKWAVHAPCTYMHTDTRTCTSLTQRLSTLRLHVFEFS